MIKIRGDIDSRSSKHTHIHTHSHRVIAGYGETSCITVARYRDAEKRDRYNETTKLDGYRLEISSIISSAVIIKRSAGLSHGPDRSHAIPSSRRAAAKGRNYAVAVEQFSIHSRVSFRRLHLGEREKVGELRQSREITETSR